MVLWTRNLSAYCGLRFRCTDIRRVLAQGRAGVYALAADFAFDALAFDVALLKEVPGVYALAADFAFDELAFDVALLKEASFVASSQTRNLGVPESYTGTTITFGFATPISGFLIDPAFVVPDTPAYLKVFVLSTTGTSYLWVGNNDSSSDFGGASGPELTSAFETYSAAFTLTAAHGSVSLAGPSVWAGEDPADEPYQGQAGSVAYAALATWLSGYAGGDVSLTLRDGEGEVSATHALAASFEFGALILDVSLLKEAAMPATGASTTLTVGFPTIAEAGPAAPDAVLADGATVID